MCVRLQLPGGAFGFGEEAVGGVVVGEDFFLWVPGEVLALSIGNYREVAE